MAQLRAHDGLKMYLDMWADTMGFAYELNMMTESTLCYTDTFLLGLGLTMAELADYKRLKSGKRQITWVAGRIAGKKALCKYPEFASSALQDIEIGKRASHAPYFKDFSEFTLSITHSHPFAVAVVAKKAIGIDLEHVIEDGPLLANYFFSEREISHLNTCEDERAYRELATIYWTKKEAIVKLLGIGATLDFKEVDTTQSKLFLESHSSRAIETLSIFIEGFGMSIAQFSV